MKPVFIHSVQSISEIDNNHVNCTHVQPTNKNMKRFIGLRESSLLMGLLIACIMTSKAQDIIVNAYAFNSEPLIDGIVDEAWADNDFLQISHVLVSDGTNDSEDFSGSFKISWFNNNLYFLFVVTDDILILYEDQPIWYGDNINLYLDLGNEKQPAYDNNDYLCHFKWGNSDYYERYNGNDLIQVDNSATAIEFAQTCDTINHTFIMEIAIRNMAELNGPSVLTDTTSIGLDAGIYDSDEAFGIFSDQLSWIDTTGLAWSDPSRLGTVGFGTIALKAAKIPEAIDRTDMTNLVKVYPTVVSDYLNIYTMITDALHIDVINLYGNKVESVVLRSENSGIDISLLNAGLYIVNVYDPKGLISSQKIIVTK
jgi:hypothetical protein